MTPQTAPETAGCQKSAKKKRFFSGAHLAARSFRPKERYVRNAGIPTLYKRGKVYYRVAGGVWESLRTSDKREAKRRLKELAERDIAKRFLAKAGLEGLAEKLDRVEKKIDQIATAPEQKSLAPTFAKPLNRKSFAIEAQRFFETLACGREQTKKNSGTYHRTLVKLVAEAKTVGTEDVSGLDGWEKFERLGPSGIYGCYEAAGAGSASLYQFCCYLRKIVPDFCAKGFLPSWHLQNLENLPHVQTPGRDLHVPEPRWMAKLVARCKELDPESGELIEAFVNTGVRRSAFLGKEGLRWENVDFGEKLFTIHLKGGKKHVLPMNGPFFRLLKSRLKRSDGKGLVFPFGSTREDNTQEALKTASAELGRELRDMHFFHALRHYFRTQHMRQGTPTRICDALTGHSPPRRPSTAL